MKVVIAEKPSVAKALAKVMGASSAKDGYLEGNGYAFTWAFGHLIQLAMPEAYGYKGWNKENLPMLPEPFKLVVKQISAGKNLYKDDPGVRKQLNVISGLFDKASEIIVATDAGREGELIFRYIYEYLGTRKPFKRLWISSQTDKAIIEGFNSLKPGADYDRVFYAARSRSESDWLVGLNSTQALSIGVGRGTYSMGRVQTPTLVMICQRYMENVNFKPEIYFQIELGLEKNSISFKATSNERWSSKETADGVLVQVKRHSKAAVVKVEIKEKTESAPLLYDLTNLQKDANKKFGMSADKTLEVAQKLYESKYISYPRTGSRYIGEDVFEAIPSLIKLFHNDEKFGAAAKNLSSKSLTKKSVNGEKVTDHHALLPTEEYASGLIGDEKLIFELIVGRMLEAFNEACIKEISNITLSATELFMAKGTVIKYQGWRAVFGEKEEEEQAENSVLPVLAEGDEVSILSAKNEQKQTKPKPIHTEGTLLQAMETCGKDVDDELAREAMKESGLGTPATRAAMIETLFTREYIERKKKSLMPTEKGLAVYELVKDRSIGKAELTGEWEKKLGLIEKGKFDAGNFMEEIKTYTSSITADLLSAGGDVKDLQDKLVAENSVQCPKCKKGVIAFVKNPKIDAAVCSLGRDACGFILFRVIAKKKLTDTQLSMLIEKKKTSVIKGFISKNEKEFDARLVMDENFKVSFEFDKKK